MAKATQTQSQQQIEADSIQQQLDQLSSDIKELTSNGLELIDRADAKLAQIQSRFGCNEQPR